MEHRNINTVGTIFNDFLGLYTGERPVGIHKLIQKYDRHPVLMGLLSNVDSVIYVDVKKAMYEIYPTTSFTSIRSILSAYYMYYRKWCGTEHSISSEGD